MNIVWGRSGKRFRELVPFVLPEPTLAHRRNLLIALGVIALYIGAGIEPKTVSAVFASGSVARPWAIEAALWVMAIYEMIMYHLARTRAEIKYTYVNADIVKFKAEVNEAAMLTKFYSLGLGISYENLDHRIDLTAESKAIVIGVYRFTGVGRMTGFQYSRPPEDMVREVSGTVWSPDNKFEFHHSEGPDDYDIFKVAFPWLRRLNFEEFMHVLFPYFAFFAMAALMVVLAFWGA